MIRKAFLLALFGTTAVLAQVGDLIEDADAAADGALDEGNDAVDTARDAFDDADDALADAEDKADDGLRDADSAVNEAVNEDVKLASEDGGNAGTCGKWLPDYDQKLWIGVSSCVGVVWWMLWGMFIYIKTNVQDVTMLSRNWSTGVAGDTIPMGWFWVNMGHPTVGYTALSYFFIWWSYLLIGVSQFIVWLMDMLMTDDKGNNVYNWLFTIWARYIGLYGSWILYFFTWLFPALQLGQIAGNIALAGYTNSIVLLTMMLIGWMGTGAIYLLAEFQTMWSKDCEPAAPEPVEEVVVEKEEPEPDGGADW